ncbi:uncharacterized protein LOC132740263 [Ruditapes philippinarum]|uniref:uncharacterized protein LOC132740263 n=1 Tax=Ruditapes philippinarum TaxID=129788 RepID=UPI00295C1ED6|nr:uncharacterized protein LOC132740263 [Ruditapes philippinarum]
MSTQRLLFVENYKYFMNWSDCVEGIKITGLAMFLFMKTKVEEEEGIKPILKDVRLFFEHNKQYMKQVSDKVYMISHSHRCCCTKCTPLFNIIEEKFIQPGYPIYIEDPKEVEDPSSTLLRMCLNDKEIRTKNLMDGDLKNVCKVMDRCQLIKTPENIKEVIDYRNKVMHSSSNELSDSLKDTYLTEFENLLRAYYTDVVDGFLKLIVDLKSNKHQTDDSFTEIERSIEIQIKVVENDQREFERLGYKVPTLDDVLEIVKKHKGTFEDVNRIKQLREATLDEAIKAGKKKGAEALKEGGFVGEKLGSITGGAGAYAAGNAKMVYDALKKKRLDKS